MQSLELGENDVNITGIYLFGSIARGDHVPGSDADILIILKRDERRFIDRISYYMKYFLNISIPVEVFPYTEREIKKMQQEGNHFISTILKEKITLFKR